MKANGSNQTRLTNNSGLDWFATWQPGPTKLIQFSVSNYPVIESNQRVTLTVIRGGDTTDSASVSYATNDAAGLTNCNVFNGIASPRCDYDNTIRTLNWAACDASETTISIAFVDDAFA